MIKGLVNPFSVLSCLVYIVYTFSVFSCLLHLDRVKNSSCACANGFPWCFKNERFYFGYFFNVMLV